jgi:hypothetical protein
VFRDAGLPDVLVSDRDTRFTSAFWTGLHAALGASLIFGSPHHHNTTSKVERVNGVIADVLRSFAGERADDWPALVPLVEFAINDSASPLGSGYTPFYADRGQHPRRPLAPAAAADPAAPSGSGEAAAHLMGRVTAEVRALLQERQDRRKAELDAARRDVHFALGDELLLDTEHTPLPSRSLLSPRWMGPFKVLARTAPNTYRLDIPAAWRVFQEFNVERLLPYLRRPDSLGGDAGPPPPVTSADGEQEHEVQELLRFKLRYGRPYVLVRWAGSDASGDTWEPLDNLTNCEEAIVAFERAPSPRQVSSWTPRRPARRRPAGTAGGADAALLVARRRLAAWHRSPYLPAWGLLACGGLPPADVGPARHGGHAARRGHVRLPLGASLPGSRSRGRPRPATSSSPALTLGLAGGSSQLVGPARVVPGPGRATAASNGRQI